MLSSQFLKRCLKEKVVDTKKYRYVIDKDIRNDFLPLIRYEFYKGYCIKQKYLGAFYNENGNMIFKKWSDCNDYGKLK